MSFEGSSAETEFHYQWDSTRQLAAGHNFLRLLGAYACTQAVDASPSR